MQQPQYQRITEDATIEEVFTAFVTTKPLGRKTARDYETTLRKNAPHLLSVPITSLTQEQVIHVYLTAKERGCLGVANKLHRLLRALCNFAGLVGRCPSLIAENPTRILRPLGLLKPLDRRSRRLQPEHMPMFRRLLAGLDDSNRLYYASLLLTGLRKEEARIAQWQHLDFSRGTWTIPAEHTKNGRAHTVYLPRQLLEAMKAHKKEAKENEPIFCGRFSHTPIDPRAHEPWHKHGIDARPHDLRRTFASTVIELGYSEIAVKRLINHKSGDVTYGYLNLSASKLTEITQAVADELDRQAHRRLITIQ
ncbi:MAG: tyrosine-type recombinase/integrase [Candidatus Melainabacteria bacterium]|nr:tyrosine-type recombinase/integrase [Candidatus Melainabacteria bacterium]